MNELLQKHGCSNVFSMPEGLKELMSDISREVLRDQPTNICDFIANYLSVLLITREHGILAVKILDDLCDCKPSVSEHLLQLGMSRADTDVLAQVIKNEIVGFELEEGREKVRETQILMKVLKQLPLDEEMVAKVCHVARNAFRDYWYRKRMLEQSLKVQPDEPWEIAAQHTLEIYKKTRPSFCELSRATQKIQAAYRGYHVRRNLLGHLKPKPRKTGPKVELPGPPIDVAEARDIDLGRIIDIKVKDDNVGDMFDEHTSDGLGLQYDPMRTITHVEDVEDFDDAEEIMEPPRSSRLQSRMMSTKSMNSRIQMLPPDVSKAKDLISRDSLHLDTQSQSMGSQVPPQDTSMYKTSFASEPNELNEEPEADDLVAEEISEVPEVLNYFEPPEAGPESREGEPEIPEEGPKIPEEGPEILEAGPEIPEEGPEIPEEGPEIPEAGPEIPGEGPEIPEAGPEIPEDLPDDHTEGDVSSVLSSGPPTADDVATDVEDAADTGASEDEGD